MKRIKKVLSIILSLELIALAYVLFIIPNGFISFGVDGIGAIIYAFNGINPAVNIILINSILLLICSLFASKESIKRYLLPALGIPLFILINFIVLNNYKLELPEVAVTLLVAGTLSGTGYSMLYRNGYGASVIFLVEDLIGKYTKIHSKIYSWIIDIVLLIILLITKNYRIMIYSLVIIGITKYMTTKARFGINSSKMFYIFTNEDNEVKNYILHVLGYELTVLDSRGGYTKEKSKILISVIDSKDYYKVKTGIKEIDPKAFIAITDTYDVINAKTF